MTKKNLTWRLKELPDAVDVAELVDKKIITAEEARDLLFNDKTNDSNKVKELEEEVKFLRELCDKLASKSNGWTTIVREYERYKPTYPTWYAGYSNVTTSTNLKTVFSSAGAGVALGATTGSLNNQKMLSKLN